MVLLKVGERYATMNRGDMTIVGKVDKTTIEYALGARYYGDTGAFYTKQGENVSRAYLGPKDLGWKAHIDRVLTREEKLSIIPVDRFMCPVDSDAYQKMCVPIDPEDAETWVYMGKLMVNRMGFIKLIDTQIVPSNDSYPKRFYTGGDPQFQFNQLGRSYIIDDHAYTSMYDLVAEYIPSSREKLAG